jgi:hypothetical protein
MTIQLYDQTFLIQWFLELCHLKLHCINQGVSQRLLYRQLNSYKYRFHRIGLEQSGPHHHLIDN